MSLSLDTRQRAMLQEMGVTVWAPAEAAVAPVPPIAAAVAAAPAGATAVRPAAPPPASTPTAPAPTPGPAPSAQRAATTPPVPAATAAAPASAAATALTLHAPQALYPSADPSGTPAGLGGGWLIVAETATPADPLAGDAGRLLDNMLRAMQLHRHPRVFLAALERAAPGSGGDTDIPTRLAQAVATLQPSMVLVLGHVAARAALARTEPLGRLRAGPHALAGCPAVVTYDPAFLLRSQETKAAAWADLCRALATVRAA